MSDTVTLNSANFESEVMKSDVPVLVDFWAPWCGPCRMVAPVLEAIATEYKGRLTVGKLDVDQEGEIAQRYGIVSIPTMIIFKGGKAVDKKVGAGNKADIERFFSSKL